jgi:hypothetical protein
MHLARRLQLARDPEGFWRSQGWGPEWRFRTARRGGRRLDFSIRVPVDWNAFDVMKMPAEAATRPGGLAQAVQALAQGVDAAGVIAIMGIGHDLPREGEPDAHLFVLLSVALRVVPGPFPDSIPGARVDPILFEHEGGNYPGVRVRRVHHAEALSGEPPMSLLTVQYLVQTDYGVLASTFVTPQVAVFETLMPLLDKVAGAGELSG